MYTLAGFVSKLLGYFFTNICLPVSLIIIESLKTFIGFLVVNSLFFITMENKSSESEKWKINLSLRPKNPKLFGRYISICSLNIHYLWLSRPLT